MQEVCLFDVGICRTIASRLGLDKGERRNLKSSGRFKHASIGYWSFWDKDRGRSLCFVAFRGGVKGNKEEVDVSAAVISH